MVNLMLKVVSMVKDCINGIHRIATKVHLLMTKVSENFESLIHLMIFFY